MVKLTLRPGQLDSTAHTFYPYIDLEGFLRVCVYLTHRVVNGQRAGTISHWRLQPQYPEQSPNRVQSVSVFTEWN